MDARTLQALTRERPSTIPASTEKPVAVERTGKLVAVNLTSGSKDCPIRLSKSTITSAGEAVRSRLIQQGKEKGLQIHVAQIPELPSLSRITNQHRMERTTRRTLRCNCGPKITPLSLQRQSASAGPKCPMNQLEVHHEAIKIKERLFEESVKGNTRLQPTTRPLKESTKTGWRWYP